MDAVRLPTFSQRAGGEITPGLLAEADLFLQGVELLLQGFLLIISRF